VLIFPLVDLEGRRSPHLAAVLAVEGLAAK